MERVAYATSKAAVISLTKGVARQFAKQGIRANCVCPGAVETTLLSDVHRITRDENAAFPSVEPLLGRRAQPEEVAHFALYLASDESSYVTGGVFPVDGGAGAR
jgi:2-keto-3-deoxy-L-fuconate dehydrogenase